METALRAGMTDSQERAAPSQLRQALPKSLGAAPGTRLDLIGHELCLLLDMLLARVSRS